MAKVKSIQINGFDSKTQEVCITHTYDDKTNKSSTITWVDLNQPEMFNFLSKNDKELFQKQQQQRIKDQAAKAEEPQIEVEKPQIEEQEEQKEQTATPLPPANDTTPAKPFPYSMHVLSGFIAVIGVTAVAVGFLALNAASFGIAGLVVSAIGAATILAGVGLFAAASVRNHRLGHEPEEALTTDDTIPSIMTTIDV